MTEVFPAMAQRSKVPYHHLSISHLNDSSAHHENTKDLYKKTLFYGGSPVTTQTGSEPQRNGC